MRIGDKENHCVADETIERIVIEEPGVAPFGFIENGFDSNKLRHESYTGLLAHITF